MSGKILLAFVLVCCMLVPFLSGCTVTVPDNNVDGTNVDNNAEGETDIAPSLPDLVSFSVIPGVYHSDFELELLCENDSYEIRYTDDCSKPVADSELYDGKPFEIKIKNKVRNTGVTVYNYRAAAFDPDTGECISEILTGSFFMTSNEDRFTTPIVSLVTDSDNLYGYENGIMVPGKLADDYAAGLVPQEGNYSANYNLRGRASEREVNLQFFEGETLSKVQDLGMRMFGKASRANQQKSMRFFARKSYDADGGMFSYPFFKGLTSLTGIPTTEFDTFIIRGAASNWTNTIITTPMMLEMAKGMDMEVTNFRSTCVFLNGEYYGIMMILEDTGPGYFETHYGIPKEEIATINATVLSVGGVGWEMDDGPETEFQKYKDVENFIQSADMTIPANYKLACKYIDIDNYIEYIAFNCYFDNYDWPRNNVRVWRRYAGGYDPDAAYGWDGRWRYIFKDLDILCGVSFNIESGQLLESNYHNDYFWCILKDFGSNIDINDMFQNLINNTQFWNKYILYTCDMMATRFSEANVLRVISELQFYVASEMPNQIKKFTENPDTLADWDACIQKMRRFAIRRPVYVKADLEEKLGQALSEVTIETSEGGTLKINTLSFSDETFTLNYPSKMSIPYEAIPDEGYKFVGFKIEGAVSDSRSKTIKVNASEAVIKAYFEPDTDYVEKKKDETADKKIVINEIGFSAESAYNGYDWVELYNPTEESIYLNGWILTDSSSEKEHYVIPSLTLDPGEYMLIYCSGKKSGIPNGEFHAPFKLSTGERLKVIDRSGMTVDFIDLTTYSDTLILARYPDGGDFAQVIVTDMTPGYANAVTGLYDSGVGEYELEFPERVYQAFLVNGTLITKDRFGVDGSGRLTINRALASEIFGYSANSEAMLASIFQNADQSIPVTRFFEMYSSGEKIYVEKLDSYVFYLAK